MSSYNRLGKCFFFSLSSSQLRYDNQLDPSASELRNLFVYSGATVAG
jgi:hypothetical protein